MIALLLPLPVISSYPRLSRSVCELATMRGWETWVSPFKLIHASIVTAVNWPAGLVPGLNAVVIEERDAELNEAQVSPATAPGLTPNVTLVAVPLNPCDPESRAVPDPAPS